MHWVAEKGSTEELATQKLLNAMASPTFRPVMLPALAREALQLSRDPNLDLRVMAQLIEKDQVLAARFLAVANSSFFSRAAAAMSVHAALSRIGLETARNVLLLASVAPFLFAAASKQFEDGMKQLRIHSLAVAAACTYLTKYKGISLPDASLAGLVHDLGAATLLRHVSEHQADFAELVRSGPTMVRVFQVLHPLAGARVADRWQLPESIREVIVGHHAAASSSSLMVKVVAAADGYVHALLGSSARASGGSRCQAYRENRNTEDPASGHPW
ncbi:MAG: HDOD domain-containing protein [Deltaproteobacteria bacterium]|nr:HDOD domain-containing protein [Deltaproteobacteria bacterium]